VNVRGFPIVFTQGLIEKKSIEITIPIKNLFRINHDPIFIFQPDRDFSFSTRL